MVRSYISKLPLCRSPWLRSRELLIVPGLCVAQGRSLLVLSFNEETMLQILGAVISSIEQVLDPYPSDQFK